MGRTKRRNDDGRGKINNLVSKHDHNRGGFHGKSKKSQRSRNKQELNNIDLDEAFDDEPFSN